jgi:hypothetical protein
MPATAKPPLLPSLLMGIGFGGFVDGIVLHRRPGLQGFESLPIGHQCHIGQRVIIAGWLTY